MKASSASKIAQFKGHLNATGHSHGIGCDGKTNACMSICYVDRPLKQYPAVGKALENNLNSLRACKSQKDFYELLKPLVIKSYLQYQRYLMTKADNKEKKRLIQRGHLFRWNWSGDILNQNHAKAIDQIAEEMPETTFWLYTRTWWAVGSFKHRENLHVYLSSDKDNRHIMEPLSQQMNRPIADMVLEDEKPKADYVVCPATNGKLKSKFACANCGICYKTKKHVAFLAH